MARCGVLYAQLMQQFAGEDCERIRLFAAGFVAGEAEKIYLGVCHGAMFRPAPTHRDLLSEVVMKVCRTYGLRLLYLGDEYWIGDDVAMTWLTHLEGVEVNSPIWHRIRAMICGIPQVRVDEEWHTR